jgi:hypothetical protein
MHVREPDKEKGKLETILNNYGRNLYRWSMERFYAVSQPPPKPPSALPQEQKYQSEIKTIVELMKELEEIERRLDSLLEREKEYKEYIKRRFELINQIKANGKKIGCPFFENINLENRRKILGDPHLSQILHKHLQPLKSQEKSVDEKSDSEKKLLLQDPSRLLGDVKTDDFDKKLSEEEASSNRLAKLPELKPHQIIERATYFVIYRIEYNAIYQFCALSSLKDHCNNMTQLLPLYQLVFGKLEKFWDVLSHPSRVRFWEGARSLPQGIQKDLDYLKNHEKINHRVQNQIKSLTLSQPTRIYLEKLEKIEDPFILFGHFMVLLHVNTHGGTFGLRTGLIDVYKRAGLKKNIDFFIKKEPYRFSNGPEDLRRKVKKLKAGAPGGYSFIEHEPYLQYQMRAWIDSVCTDPDGSINDDKIDRLLKGYMDCFSDLGSIYEVITKEANFKAPLKSTPQTKSLLKESKISYTPEDRLSNIQLGKESDFLVQLEHILHRSPFQDDLRKIGVQYIRGLDDEPGATHSPLSPSSRPAQIAITKEGGKQFGRKSFIKSRAGEDEVKYYRLSALPSRTIRLIVAREQDQKILKASWVDYNGLSQRIKMLLPESNVDFQLFDDDYLKAVATQLVVKLQKSVHFLMDVSSEDKSKLEDKSEDKPEHKLEDKSALPDENQRPSQKHFGISRLTIKKTSRISIFNIPSSAVGSSPVFPPSLESVLSSEVSPQALSSEGKSLPAESSPKSVFSPSSESALSGEVSPQALFSEGKSLPAESSPKSVFSPSSKSVSSGEISPQASLSEEESLLETRSRKLSKS